jgi:hypothetical protein
VRQGTSGGGGLVGVERVMGRGWKARGAEGVDGGGGEPAARHSGEMMDGVESPRKEEAEREEEKQSNQVGSLACPACPTAGMFLPNTPPLCDVWHDQTRPAADVL